VDATGGSDTAPLNITVDVVTYDLTYTAGANGSISGTTLTPSEWIRTALEVRMGFDVGDQYRSGDLRHSSSEWCNFSGVG
jgi:hypothetical protein